MIQQDSVIHISDSLYNIANQNSDSIITDSIINAPIEKLVQLSLNPINTPNNYWALYWIGIIGLFVFISKLSFPKHFNNIFQALINNRAYNNLVNEGVNWRHPIAFLLSIAYILSIGLVLFTSTNYSSSYQLINYDWDIILALKITLSIVVLIFTKLFIVLVTQIIFQIRDLLHNYLNYLFFSYSFLGIILFFVLWILIYSDYQYGISTSIIIISMVYLYRIYKLLSLCNSKNNFNLFHFIIYLCTVEILPLIIFRKLYFIWFF